MPKYYLRRAGRRVQVTREDFMADAIGVRAGVVAPAMVGGPQKLEALAVDPRDRVEAMAIAAAHGAPTVYDTDGVPEITDRAHRNRFLDAHERASQVKLFDRNAGYGDRYRD